MTPEQYRAEQASIAGQSQTKAFEIVGLLSAAGSLVSVAEVASVVGSLVAVYNTSAAMLGDAFVSSRIGKLPVGVGRQEGEAIRIEHSVRELLEVEPEPLPNIERLAFSEPLSAGRSASRESMHEHEVTEYVFDLDENPCGLCQWLGSRTWPISQLAITHPNCQCIIYPIESED